MRKYGFLGIAAALVATLLVAGAAPAAYPSGEIFQAFWELNIGGEGYIVVPDCIRFTNKQVCSTMAGNCSPFHVTGSLSDSITTSQFTVYGADFLGGGRVDCVGSCERRGPLGSCNYACYYRDRLFAPPVLRYNGSIDAHEENDDSDAECTDPIPSASPISRRDLEAARGTKRTTAPR